MIRTFKREIKEWFLLVAEIHCPYMWGVEITIGYDDKQ